jgi:hypothetical protein
VIAVVFLAASFFLYRHTHNFVQTASHTQGTVTKLVQSGKTYFPVYTFKDSQGKERSIESLSGSYPAAYKIGDHVVVIYSPDKPDAAEIDSFFDIWIWPIALAFFGALDFLFGLGTLAVNIFLKRSKRKFTIAHAT